MYRYMCIIIYIITFYTNDIICTYYAILTEICLMTYLHYNIYLLCFILLLKCINIYSLHLRDQYFSTTHRAVMDVLVIVFYLFVNACNSLCILFMFFIPSWIHLGNIFIKIKIQIFKILVCILFWIVYIILL